MKSLEFMRLQFEISKAQASYWQAMAVTGAATKRHISHGVEREFTDAEKIQDALNTMQRHIHNMNETAEAIYDELMKLEAK